MGNYHIRMQFDIEADQATVRAALTSAEGIASWWSNHIGGNPEVDGGRLVVSFPDVPVPFEFDVSHSNGRIEWAAGTQPEHWAGTTVRWETGDNPEGEGTRLRFSHRDYDEASPVIDIVTPAWAQIIQRLVGYAQTGEAQPFFDF